MNNYHFHKKNIIIAVLCVIPVTWILHSHLLVPSSTACSPCSSCVSWGRCSTQNTVLQPHNTCTLYTTSTTVWQQHLGLGFFRFLFIFHVLICNTDVFTVLCTDHINAYLHLVHGPALLVSPTKAFLCSFCWLFFKILHFLEFFYCSQGLNVLYIRLLYRKRTFCVERYC